MKARHWILGGTAVLLLAVQFVPNELPAVTTENPGDLLQSGLVEESAAKILKNSCYDCHSNETVYPWYSHVAPASWLVSKDIRAAREELNFSTWEDYDLMDKLGKLDDAYIEVEEGKMPLGIYTLMHPSAKLDESERQILLDWAETTMDALAEEGDSEGTE